MPGELLEEDRPPVEPMEYHSEETAAPGVDEPNGSEGQHAAGKESAEGGGTRPAEADEPEPAPDTGKEPDQRHGAAEVWAARSPSPEGAGSVTRDPSVKMLMEIFPGTIRSVTELQDPEQDEPHVGTGELSPEADHDSPPDPESD